MALVKVIRDSAIDTPLGWRIRLDHEITQGMWP